MLPQNLGQILGASPLTLAGGWGRAQVPGLPSDQPRVEVLLLTLATRQILRLSGTGGSGVEDQLEFHTVTPSKIPVVFTPSSVLKSP